MTIGLAAQQRLPQGLDILLTPIERRSRIDIFDPVERPPMTPFTHLTQATSIGSLHRFGLRCIVLALAIATVACGTTSSTTSTGPSPVKCQVTLSSSLNSIGPSGGSGTITVATQPECAWTVIAEMNWISELTPTSGQGNGQVQFKVGENQVASARAGDIVINDSRLRLQQEAAACRIEVSPSDHDFDARGGSGEIRIGTATGCTWTATSDAGWISISSGASGSGAGGLRFDVAANAGAARSGSLVVAGQQSVVRQANGGSTPGCTYTLSANAATVPATGGPGGVALVTAATCPWTATSNASWLTITSSTSGVGPASITFVADALATGSRLGTLTIGGQVFTVTQTAASASCTYAINPTSQSIGAGGGTGTPIALTAGPGCAWTAASNAPWITVTSAASGSDNATINFSVAANSGGERSGTLTIGGQTFTVTQAAAPTTPCSYGINPTSQSIGAGGGTATTQLSAANGCTWTAASNASWITLTSATSGSGNTTVGYNVAANSGGARSGTLTIAGQTFTVNQAAAAASPTCSYSIKPSSQSLGPAAGTGTVAVSSAGGCPWTAVSNASWITITSGSSGSGNGTVGFSVAANSGGSRTGTITIADSTFTVTQDAACAYQIDPNNQSIGANGGAGTQVRVSTTSGCTWTATSNASWITVTFGASGSGNGNVNFNVAPNTGTSTRTGTLTIAGRTFTVSQDRLVCNFNLSRNSQSFEEQGGNGSVDVDAATGCAWTATSQVSWIQITSGQSGVGDGTVRYHVDRNHGNERTGTLIIAGRTFTVTQEEDE